FHFTYRHHRHHPPASRKSPNRKVGDLSLQPTGTTDTTRLHRANPPTGRLGVFHFNLQAPQTPPACIAQIPQPEGWGSFTSTYRNRRPHSRDSPSPLVG